MYPTQRDIVTSPKAMTGLFCKKIKKALTIGNTTTRLKWLTCDGVPKVIAVTGSVAYS